MKIIKEEKNKKENWKKEKEKIVPNLKQLKEEELVIEIL